MGDACHLHSPAGGQGMNTGIQESNNLGWKLSFVIKGLCSREILSTYHDERHEIGKSLVKVTSLLTKITNTKNPIISFLRNNVFRMMGYLEFIQIKLMIRMTNIGFVYDKSLTMEVNKNGIFSNIYDMLNRKRVQSGSKINSILLNKLKFKTNSIKLLLFLFNDFEFLKFEKIGNLEKLKKK
jgi:hypothetical protein